MSRHPKALPQRTGGDDELLTPNEVAEMFRVSVETVYAWNKNRKRAVVLGLNVKGVIGPPSYSLGIHVRYIKSEVWQWFAERGDDVPHGLDAKELDDFPLLKARQVAEILETTPDELEKMMIKGTAPPYRVDGQVKRWAKNEVLAWQEKQRGREPAR
jgi:predicted DNA-binding transcriptional regulator AlpA